MRYSTLNIIFYSNSYFLDRPLDYNKFRGFISRTIQLFNTLACNNRSMEMQTPNASPAENVRKAQYEMGQNLIASHLRPFPGQTVLDLGCGRGRFTREIGSAVGKQGRVLGVDPNTAAIAVATEEERRCSESHQRNVKFMAGLVHDAVQHGPFDAVFSHCVFHWIPEDDTDATMSSIVRCLKPGGRLCAVLTPGTGGFANPLTLFIKRRLEESATGMHLRPLNHWTSKLKQAGLHIEHAEQEEDTMGKFPSVRSYLELVKSCTEGAVDYKMVNADELADFISNQGLGSLDSPYVCVSIILTIIASKPATGELN